MKIITLELRGFLSYQDETLNLSNVSTACITGANGSGKSSLLDAITWALFGVARRKDDAIINAQSNIASVGVEFEYENDRYRVLRTKKREKPVTLEVKILSDGKWKAMTEATVRDTEARIQSILKMDYETFTNASFFLQGRADQFTQQNPSTRKRILASILGLEDWERYKEIASGRRRRIEGDLAIMAARLGEIDTELGEEHSRRQAVEIQEEGLTRIAAIRQLQESQLSSLQTVYQMVARERQVLGEDVRQYERLTRELATADGTLLDRRTDLARYQEMLKSETNIRARYAAWQKTRECLTHYNVGAGRAQQFRDQMTRAQMSLQRAEDALHAELGQLIHQSDEAARTQVTRQLVELEVGPKRDEMGSLIEETQRIASVEQQTDALTTRQAELQAENGQLRNEMQSLKARIARLEQIEGQEDCPHCGQSLSDTGRVLLIDELTVQGKTMGDLYRANETIRLTVGQEIETLRKELQELKGKERRAQEISRAIAGLESRLEGLNQAITTWERKGAIRLTEIQNTLETQDFAAEQRDEIARLQADLLGTGYDFQAHQQAIHEEEGLRDSDFALRGLEVALARQNGVEREIEILTVRRNELNVQLEAKSNIPQQQEELAEMETKAGDLEGAQDKLMDLQTQERQAMLQLGAVRQKLAVLSELRLRRAQIEAEKTGTADLVARLLTLEKAFGREGVPALLIEQALPEIEREANDMLDHLSNGMMGVRFITQREFKDKKREDLKETLDIIVRDPNGEREYETYSGGEAFRVNFAIRMALSRVLAQRAGARLKMLVIDEGFGTQDDSGRQRLIEAINAVSGSFAQILVITHVDSLKDVFPTRIEVSKNGSGSKVSVL